MKGFRRAGELIEMMYFVVNGKPSNIVLEQVFQEPSIKDIRTRGGFTQKRTVVKSENPQIQIFDKLVKLE